MNMANLFMFLFWRIKQQVIIHDKYAIFILASIIYSRKLFSDLLLSS